MTQNQVLSLVRWVLATGGTFFVTKGWISNDMAVTLAGLAGPLVSVVWSLIVHKTSITGAAAKAVTAGN